MSCDHPHLKRVPLGAFVKNLSPFLKKNKIVPAKVVKFQADEAGGTQEPLIPQRSHEVTSYPSPQ